MSEGADLSTLHGPANRVAVVTGGSKGIGRAIVLALASRGYDVAILDVLDSGRQTADEAAAGGTRAIFCKTDVSREIEVDEAATEIEESLGAPCLLVNNAGIFPRSATLDTPYETWRRVLDVNLGGTFLCSRRFAPGMMSAGAGHIINLSSGRGLEGTPRGAHYAASKAGIISLTRSLALEWAPAIRVNTIVPGITDTDQPLQDMTRAELYGRGADIPLGRIAQADDIARGVCLLISEDAAYITGQCICVNGGAILH